MSQSSPVHNEPPVVGRYVLHRQLARGGMATIHLARLLGDEGFSRLVAAKRLLPELAADSEFVAMFLDEARIASKCHHRNVVPVLDVVTAGGEVLLVQELVHGVALHRLLNQAAVRTPPRIAVAIASQLLEGLHAVHEMVDELGAPLEVVHRDVSPHNVMIATDGTARLLDFGVAKATIAAHVTRAGTYKGKLAYSAPEQLRGQATRRSDIYGLAMLLWEVVVSRRMHGPQSEGELFAKVANGILPSMIEVLAAEYEWETIDDDSWQQINALDPIVRRGLALDPAQRWPNAAEMASALVSAVAPASTSELAGWLRQLGKEQLELQERAIASEEASWRRRAPTTAPGATTNAVAEVPPPRRTARRRWAIVGALAVVSVVIAGVAWWVGGMARPSGDARPALAVTTSAASAAPTPIAPAPTAPTAPTTPTTPTATPTTPAPAPIAPNAAADAPPVPRTKTVRKAPVPARRVERPKPVPPPPPQGSASADCSPAYYFEGTKKVYKPECL